MNARQDTQLIPLQMGRGRRRQPAPRQPPDRRQAPRVGRAGRGMNPGALNAMRVGARNAAARGGRGPRVRVG